MSEPDCAVEVTKASQDRRQVIFTLTNGNHIYFSNKKNANKFPFWFRINFSQCKTFSLFSILFRGKQQTTDSPSGVPGTISVLFYTSKMAHTLPLVFSVWTKDMWCLAGTLGTSWMRGTESLTSWFCAGVKAMAGELCQCYMSSLVFILHKVHQDYDMMTNVCLLPACSSLWPCRSHIPIWLADDNYVKTTRSTLWTSVEQPLSLGWEFGILPRKKSETSEGDKFFSSLWTDSKECSAAFGRRVTEVDI